jgi:F-type H+-transporting ATPase subunit b
MLLTSPALLALPVVDIDGTFFIQGGLFLLMVFLLNGLLFKPWLEVQARRTQSISGALEKAEQMQLDATAKGDEYDAKLRAARDEAMGIRSDERKEGEREAAERLSAARDEARKSLDEARMRIEKETSEARSSLSGRVDELAKDIVSKILGRAA